MSGPESSPHQNNDANDRESTDDSTDFDPSDTRQVLKELAKRASRYSINLDGLVSKDNVSCFRGGNAMVYSGMLKSNQAEGIIKGDVSSASLGDGKTTKVDLLFNHALPYL